jgi:aspartyl/asparaginyl beta-hydroxylase (cupin superfamily)
MYLTDRTRGMNDHYEVEILLESYSKQVEEIVNEVRRVTLGFVMSD